MRKLILLFIHLTFTHAANERIDPNCPDYHLNAPCHDVCIDKTLECIAACDSTDSECLSDCLRTEIVCTQNCPCDIECPNGCDQCENSICECSDVTENLHWNKCLDINGMSLARCIYHCEDSADCEASCISQFKVLTEDCPCENGCPAGCPCDSFDCEDVSPTVTTTTSTTTTTTEPVAKEAVLMLSTHRSTNVPMVIGFNGEFDDDIDFTYDTNTEVYLSCTAALNDEMWVLGGNSHEQQMSQIQGCRLTSVGEMPFYYKAGGCNTYSFGIMLCFAYDDLTGCHSFDGTSFEIEASSKFPHSNVLALGSYRDTPFVTGQYSSSNGLKTEILDYPSGQWNEAADYPFSYGDRISHYATASTDENVLIIGGYTNGQYPNQYTSIIAEYKDGNWRNVGALSQARHQHDAITIGSVTMVIGGYPNGGAATRTELLYLESYKNENINPVLSSDYLFTGSFLVEVGYCNKEEQMH